MVLDDGDHAAADVFDTLQAANELDRHFLVALDHDATGGFDIVFLDRLHQNLGRQPVLAHHVLVHQHLDLLAAGSAHFHVSHPLDGLQTGLERVLDKAGQLRAIGAAGKGQRHERSGVGIEPVNVDLLHVLIGFKRAHAFLDVQIAKFHVLAPVEIHVEHNAVFP